MVIVLDESTRENNVKYIEILCEMGYNYKTELLLLLISS